ncbi:unnamed protein product [Microthlaspi erraticum]|uniref:DUF1985 domain-containing protein n=1 Tax=Microthlaspi erraticum TaxID=1685480 RepID=A0A6D2JP32_9BRAS|nr:unnamed protein product [Microthlaspi erraticum]
MDSELPKRLFEEGAEPLAEKINKCARMSILNVLATRTGFISLQNWRPLRFSMQEYHAVTGLKCIDDGNYNLDEWVDDGGFWSRLLKSHGLISIETIRKKHVFERKNHLFKWTDVSMVEEMEEVQSLLQKMEEEIDNLAMETRTCEAVANHFGDDVKDIKTLAEGCVKEIEELKAVVSCRAEEIQELKSGLNCCRNMIVCGLGVVLFFFFIAP